MILHYGTYTAELVSLPPSEDNSGVINLKGVTQRLPSEISAVRRRAVADIPITKCESSVVYPIKIEILLSEGQEGLNSINLLTK